MHAEAPARPHPKTERAYERCLPGCGFAAIDVMAVKTMPLGLRYEGALVVERRASPRERVIIRR